MKYYAVRKGRITGIFNNWQECKNSIFRFKGAEYKSFSTLIDAKKYMAGKNKSKLFDDILDDEDDAIYVYTDGSAKNGKAGIGVFFNINDKRNVSKPLKNLFRKLTNNIAELKAIIEVYNILKKEINTGKKITIVSDSLYAIRSATTYRENYDKIINGDIVKKLFNLFKDKENVNFLHIKAHTNRRDGHYFGNYYADLLAQKSIS